MAKMTKMADVTQEKAWFRKSRVWSSLKKTSNFITKNFWDSLCTRGAYPKGLVAPYCAIPRDYLSDTPLLRAMGFLVSQHGQLGAIPPPPFWAFPPWRTCEVEVRYPPQKGYLSDTCAIPYENKANGCDTHLCDTISKGYCAIWGVSRTGPLRKVIN